MQSLIIDMLKEHETAPIGWDGSPVQDWVNEQTKADFSLERRFAVDKI